MNPSEYEELLYNNWARKPAAESFLELLKIAREKDGDVILKTKTTSISLQENYDRLMEINYEAEFEKGVKWLDEALNSPKITPEFVNIWYCLDHGRIHYPSMHQFIFDYSEDCYIPYELWEKDLKDIPLPKPELEFTVIHNKFCTFLEEEDWSDDHEKSPYDAYYPYGLAYCFAALFITNAAIKVDREKLLRGNPMIQLTTAFNDECLLLGNITKAGFQSFESINKGSQ